MLRREQTNTRNYPSLRKYFEVSLSLKPFVLFLLSFKEASVKNTTKEKEEGVRKRGEASW